ncbi:hypothetical protein Aperf_G00000003147 [Anoplocephala perfoliata]
MSDPSNFIKWFEEINCNAPEPQIHNLGISDMVDVGDRGLVALTDIPGPDGCLLTISVDDPRLLLTPDRAYNLLNQCSCNFTLSWKSTVNTRLQRPQDLLTLFFFHIKCSTHDPECSLWRLWEPYFLMLPRAFTDVAYVSSTNPEVMAGILSCLPLFLKSAFETQIQKVNGSYRRLFFDPKPSSPPTDFVWSWSAVNSRCVYVNLRTREVGRPAFDKVADCKVQFLPNTERNIAIVPFFDFFNHSPDVSVSTEVKDGVFDLKTNSKYRPNEQVFINYGKHDNLFLLCEYGFCMPDLKNPYDAIYVTYKDLVSIGSSFRLISVLQSLHLLHSENESAHWNAVYISSEGPSYYLVLILYALFSQGKEVPPRDVLFSLDEADRSAPVEQGLKELKKYLLEETKRSLEALANLGYKHSFVNLTRCLLNSRKALLNFVK